MSKISDHFSFVITNFAFSAIAANQSAQISNQSPQVSNQSPQVSNQSPQVSDQVPQISDQVPQVSDQVPQISDQMPQVPQHPRPGFFEREEKCSEMFEQGKDCGWSGGCCQMDTWLEKVAVRMRNLMNKLDGDGKLKLHNNQSITGHWGMFYRPGIKKIRMFFNKS